MERLRSVLLVGVLFVAFLLVEHVRVQERTGAWTLRETYPVKVRDVVDGDTVRVQFRNGIKDTVRLLGVDTPETTLYRVTPDEFGYPSTPAGKRRLKRAGKTASQWLRKQIPRGTVVRLRFDSTSDYRGSYNRLLGYLVKEGKNINRQLIHIGAARVYRKGAFSLKPSFIRLEREARRNNRGVWNRSGTTRSSSDRSRPRRDNQETDTVDVNCSENAYNCSHFDSYQEALRVFKACGGADNDVHRLDGNGDGEPCESLK